MSETSSKMVLWRRVLSRLGGSGQCRSTKNSWAMGSMLEREVEARESVGRRKPSTEIEAQLLRSSASMLEESWNQAAERFSAMSWYLQVVYAHLQ